MLFLRDLFFSVIIFSFLLTSAIYAGKHPLKSLEITEDFSQKGPPLKKQKIRQITSEEEEWDTRLQTLFRKAISGSKKAEKRLYDHLGYIDDIEGFEFETFISFLSPSSIKLIKENSQSSIAHYCAGIICYRGFYNGGKDFNLNNSYAFQHFENAEKIDKNIPHAEALNSCGLMYIKGEANGMSPIAREGKGDKEIGVNLLARAAQRGATRAFINLGDIYRYNDEKDKATQSFLSAAQAKDKRFAVFAYLRLGDMYYEGGNTQDSEEGSLSDLKQALGYYDSARKLALREKKMEVVNSVTSLIILLQQKIDNVVINNSPVIK